MRKNSVKNTRINSEVQRELSMIIREDIKDPRIHFMTSVTDVQVAPDLKTCKAYISVMGNEEEQQNTLTGLKSAVGYIRRELARRVNLRNTPEITFILDDSIAYGAEMSKKIADLHVENYTSDEEDAPEES
ncbi:MAG: 30S ribosome-binding factor RbfA [Lachnospiraceae bacterium]|nr:30S ribosome-binding factor RbfA [Lachnospiraceae bacterium]